MKNTGKNFKREQSPIHDDNRNDACQDTTEHPEPTICNNCGALFINGRWTWNDIPAQVSYSICPACQRIEDQSPAGIIKVKGPFFRENYSKIMGLVQNTQREETSEHPLERIIDIQNKRGTAIITTTGIHLARKIGDTLFQTYEGDLNYNYDDQNLIRVHWNR